MQAQARCHHSPLLWRCHRVSRQDLHPCMHPRCHRCLQCIRCHTEEDTCLDPFQDLCLCTMEVSSRLDLALLSGEVATATTGRPSTTSLPPAPADILHWPNHLARLPQAGRAPEEPELRTCPKTSTTSTSAQVKLKKHLESMRKNPQPGGHNKMGDGMPSTTTWTNTKKSCKLSIKLKPDTLISLQKIELKISLGEDPHQ